MEKCSHTWICWAMITVRIMKSNCFEIHLNTLDNSLTTAATVKCRRLVSTSFFIVIASVSAICNSRCVLKLQEVTGETREALVNLLGPGSAVCSVVWWVGCKAGVWQVGLINGCSVAVSIPTPAPPPPPILWSINRVRARARTAGDGLRLTALCSSCVMWPLTAAEPAVMHVISAYTKVANTIQYKTPSISSDTMLIQ